MSNTQHASVLNLSTGEVRVYTLHPTEAVVAAYAQGTAKDYNTWNYAKYRPLVEVHNFSVSCGDWTTMLPDWESVPIFPLPTP